MPSGARADAIWSAPSAAWGARMASMFLLTYSAPIKDLEIGEVLITQGEMGTDLFVLESGQLAVERDGVKIATIDQSDSLIGEMGLLLHKPHSATVRAETNSKVRVVADAMRVLERHPDITLRLASLLCHRLDETSGLVSELSRQVSGSAEKTLVGRILSSLVTTPGRRAVRRWARSPHGCRLRGSHGSAQTDPSALSLPPRQRRW